MPVFSKWRNGWAGKRWSQHLYKIISLISIWWVATPSSTVAVTSTLESLCFGHQRVNIWTSAGQNRTVSYLYQPSPWVFASTGLLNPLPLLLYILALKILLLFSPLTFPILVDVWCKLFFFFTYVLGDVRKESIISVHANCHLTLKPGLFLYLGLLIFFKSIWNCREPAFIVFFFFFSFLK